MRQSKGKSPSQKTKIRTLWFQPLVHYLPKLVMVPPSLNKLSADPYHNYQWVCLYLQLYKPQLQELHKFKFHYASTFKMEKKKKSSSKFESPQKPKPNFYLDSRGCISSRSMRMIDTSNSRNPNQILQQPYTNRENDFISQSVLSIWNPIFNKQRYAMRSHKKGIWI